MTKLQNLAQTFRQPNRLDKFCAYCQRQYKGDERLMVLKDEIQNKQLTEELLFTCLVTCEDVISKNAYLEKKWCNYNNEYGFGAYNYKVTRLEWSDYRSKLRSVLQTRYQMKDIIRITKTYKDKTTQKVVLAVVELINSNDYMFV